MKKIISIVFVLLISFILYGCYEEHVPVIFVNDEGFVVINDIVTEYLVVEPNEDFDITNIGYTSDGYWIINGKPTNYMQSQPLTTSVSEDGYLMLFDIKTEIQIEIPKGGDEVEYKDYQNMGSLFPNVSVEMLDPNFWISLYDDADEVILTATQIQEFNTKTIAIPNTNVVDLLNLDENLSQSELINLISKYSIPNRNYLNNQIITQNDKNILLEKRNLENIPPDVEVKFAVVVKNCDLRTFPTAKRLTNNEDGLFDYFQETGLKIGEGVVVYHTTLDQEWTFVRSENYDGWVETKAIAISSKAMMQEFIEPQEFIIITADRLRLDNSSYNQYINNIVLDMGTKIPLVGNPPAVVDRHSTAGCYVVRIPCSDDFGNLIVVETTIPVTKDVSNGYLPYTTTNIINQAMKLHGTRYGWGDMDGNRDCSSTVAAVYKCFGFKMPRNTSNQQYLPGDYVTISEAQPGTLIYVSGHVLLYLGKVGTRYYAIHNFSQYRVNNQNHTAMGCYITCLTLQRTNGNMYLTSIIKSITMK